MLTIDKLNKPAPRQSPYCRGAPSEALEYQYLRQQLIAGKLNAEDRQTAIEKYPDLEQAEHGQTIFEE